MCGICGFYHPKQTDSGVLQAMTSKLRHRGPDQETLHIQEPIYFGHQRLSIIDLQGSNQPLFNEDKTLILVYNGEIYNFQSLRQELVSLGHRFSTAGDGEVLLHAYEEYGKDLLSRVDGMFAFALYDTRNQTLLLARDHLGVKPLYYYFDGDFIAFASELKSLLVHPAIKRELNLRALTIYLQCQFIPAPHTIYSSIYKLEAGQALSFHQGDIDLFSYWRPDYSSKIDIEEPEAVDYAEKEIRRSVESMLVSDVPLGAFISGGVDSGLLAAMMTDITGGPIETFNVGFEHQSGISEHREASSVANHIKSHHHLLMMTAEDVNEQISGFFDFFDEPMSDQAALPTYLLARFARESVKVVLTGEGADEVFGGYDHHRKRVHYDHIINRLTFPGSPVPLMSRLIPPRTRKSAVLFGLSRPRAKRYLTHSVIFHELILPRYLAPSLSELCRGQLADLAERYYQECGSSSYIDKLLCIDTRFWMPNDLLVKIDLATMAQSLEARVPFLDRQLVENVAALPAHLKLKGETTKYLLKKVAERYLPREIVYRPKHGFLIPLAAWMREEFSGLILEHLSPKGLARRGIFDSSKLEELIGRYKEGKYKAPQLWSLLCLELWFKKYEPDFELG
jgi:asparagine synthase (glutamine-hydrolysing)